MQMKKLVLAFIAVLAAVLAAVAQTPEEIVSRMEAEMNSLSFDVTEADVTFDIAKYPGVKIIRK